MACCSVQAPVHALNGVRVHLRAPLLEDHPRITGDLVNQRLIQPISLVGSLFGGVMERSYSY